MALRALLVLGLFSFVCCAVIIDRIALIAGDSIVKDSDIERDMRLTEFLNGQPLSFTPAERKSAASRLLDQTFIRQEIRAGDYPRATTQDAEKQLQQLKQHRFRTTASYEAALNRYRITDDDVQRQLRWQLTVLNFIDQRFKPAAYVGDDEVAAYYQQHAAELRRQNPGKTTVADLRPVITDALSGEKVNKLFFAWLDEQRQNAKVKYLEEGLK